jgi:hypothetical protein
LVLFTAACVAGVVAYIAVRERSGVHAPSGPGAPAPPSSPAQTVTLETLKRAPHLYFRSYRGSEFGRVVVASLERPDDERVVTALECERLAFGGEVGLCLSDNRASLQPPGLALLVGERLEVRHTVPLAGVPSRARLSHDQTLAASTVFVAGESYASSSFSTRTHLLDMKTGQAMPDLEQFVTLRDGRPIRAADFNFWGVTFARDANRFYATLATNGRTYLVEGDVRSQTLRVMRENVECPSISPDDARIVYKRRVEGTAEWRLHVLELATLRDWPLVEHRSIDDQVEWLDNDHVLYGFLEERGLPEDAMHVWVSPVAERSQQAPRLFVRAAASPSVVRPLPSAGTP